MRFFVQKNLQIAFIKKSKMYKLFLACHIISFTAWMAGLLYLPRLFAYHAMEKTNSAIAEKFVIMEYRLLKIIMNPAMILTWIFGLSLFFTNSYTHYLWFFIKLFLVIILTIFHIQLGKWRKKFSNGENNKSEKFYRRINELPTFILILVVFLVIYKP